MKPCLHSLWRQSSSLLLKKAMKTITNENFQLKALLGFSRSDIKKESSEEHITSPVIVIILMGKHYFQDNKQLYKPLKKPLHRRTIGNNFSKPTVQNYN